MFPLLKTHGCLDYLCHVTLNFCFCLFREIHQKKKQNITFSLSSRLWFKRKTNERVTTDKQLFLWETWSLFTSLERLQSSQGLQRVTRQSPTKWADEITPSDQEYVCAAALAENKNHYMHVFNPKYKMLILSQESKRCHGYYFYSGSTTLFSGATPRSTGN